MAKHGTTNMNDIVTITTDTVPVAPPRVTVTTSTIAYVDPLADIKKRLDKLENRFQFVDVTKEG